MKIYFDGDSWTRGNEIDEEQRLSKRFNALISKELGAEEYNISSRNVVTFKASKLLLKYINNKID